MTRRLRASTYFTGTGAGPAANAVAQLPIMEVQAVNSKVLIFIAVGVNIYGAAHGLPVLPRGHQIFYKDKQKCAYCQNNV